MALAAIRPMAHRILVADDDADTPEGLTTLLAGWGYEVEQARDGDEAFQRALAFRPDLVIADLVMAGMDGPPPPGAVQQDPAPPPRARDRPPPGERDEGRGVRLHHEAGGDATPPAPHREGAREVGDHARGHAAPPSAQGGARPRASARHEPPDAGDLSPDRGG